MNFGRIRFNIAVWGSGLFLFSPSVVSAQSAGTLSMTWHQEMGPAVRARAAEVLSGAGAFMNNVGEALRQASPTGSAFWHLEITLYSLLFMAVGFAAARGVMRWGRQHFMYLFKPEPSGRTEKIGYLLMRGAMQSVGVAIFVAVAMGLSILFDSGQAAARHTHFIQISAVAAAWWISVLFANLLAHDVPSHRVLPLDDATAGNFHHYTVTVFAISFFIVSLCLWMEAMGLDPDAHALSLIIGVLLSALLFTVLAGVVRRPMAELILGLHKGAEKPLPLRLLAQTWHVWAGLYFIGAWAVTAVRILLNLPGAAPLVLGPIIALFIGIVIYGLLLLLIDRQDAKWQLSAPQPDISVEEDEPQTGPLPHFQRPRSLKDLVENAAALLALMAGIAILLAFWGVDVTSDEHKLVRLADIVIILFLSYLGYQAIKISIDQKIAAEGGEIELEPGEEGGGGGASRLATLLPLARNFLLITVVVMSGMILLSQLGVDIAPLFAGAGVVGLAIGFGAQTLIRDIFSGAFFLIDDAFRRGEYIDCGEVKGTVEKISIRSMQLRHHLGALHTIPFGEIQKLTNYSRDWSMMKLSLRVTYDTDVEKVRKLIKKLGQELMEHPEMGEKFLQPLKSQGVLAMEDSAMILRVKFMTLPGEQFVVRKLVFARIRELFEKEGIKFAHRQVTVRVAPEEEGAPELPKERQEAIAGAAVPALEEEDLAGEPEPDR